MSKIIHDKKINRRELLSSAGSVLGTAAIYGGIAPAVLAQSKAPLRIGSLNSYSKVFAALANGNLNGMNLYFEQIGGSIAGRKIEIIREDDEINPQVGLQKMRKLHENDKCDLITGIQASNVALAAVEYIRQTKAFFLCSGAGLTNLSYTQIPYFFRSSLSTYTIHNALGEWFFDNVAKEAILTASDFAGGRGCVAEFKSGYLPKGGKIIQEIYPPLGNNDFSSYLATIRNANAPATFNFYAGTDAVRFVKQYAEYGLRSKTRLIASGFMVDSDTLPAQGASALGIVNTLHYADTLDNPANKKFVADYLKKYNEYPSVYSEYGYVAAMVMHAAIEAVDGNTQDKDKLRAAMLKVSLNAPRGPFRFNPNTQSPIQNVYIREVAEIGGRITNKIIGTKTNVIEPNTQPY